MRSSLAWSVGRAYPWVLLILLCAFGGLPALFSPIEEHSYDAATFHVYRGVLFSEARDEGIFYPRWVQAINAGLGGPLFNFYSPLSYFAMDILHSAGLAHPAAWRLLVALAVLLAASGTYALVRALGGTAGGGIVAATLFAYSLPLVRELFERGSPQGFALALYPWILWASVSMIQRPSGQRLALSALAWAATILTHNLSASFLVPLLAIVVFTLWPGHRWRAAAWPAIALAAGLSLSAFFSLPFLLERRFVQMANALDVDYGRVAQNAIPLSELLSQPALFDVGFDNNSVGDHLGVMPAAVSLAGLLLAPLLWRKGRRWESAATASLAGFGWLIIGLQTTAADPIWRMARILAYVQIRTRLLGLVALSAALLAGLLMSRWRSRQSVYIAGLVAASSILLTMPYLYAQLQHRYATFTDVPTVEDAERFMIQENVPGLTAFNEFLPIWRRLPFSAEEVESISHSLLANLPEGSQVIYETHGTDWTQIRLDGSVPFDAIFHILYFPGWEGRLDGKPHPLTPTELTGYVTLKDVPAGEHTLSLRYRGTAVQWGGSLLSGAIAIALLGCALVWRGTGSSAPKVDTALKPNGWLLIGLIVLVGLKTFWLDARTTLLRRDSQCASLDTAGEATFVRFDDTITLCGYELPAHVFRPGDTIRLTLYWQAEEAIGEPAESFVQVLGTTFNPDTGNPLWGQQNKQLPGYHPVTRWVPRKIYRDVYDVPIGSNAPAGTYQLEIGWWQTASGRRLSPTIQRSDAALSISHLDSLLLSGIAVR